MLKKIWIILGIILISAFSAVFADRYLFPRLASTKLFSKYDFLKRTADNVTVINRTEQVYVKEESSINKITNQAASSVVNIISFPDPSRESVQRNLPAASVATSENFPVSGIRNGTGLVVTSDGIIMTYASSVNIQGHSHKVLLSDGNTFDAELLGVDSWSNLAFFKIVAANLSSAAFADSNEASAGEKLILIGNSSESHHNQYAAGLLSGINRTFNLGGKALSVSEKMEGVFEVDFGGMPGYVGGPAVDYTGQIVGILGSIEKDGRNAFFLIPSNEVRVVLERAIAKKLSEDYQLGIYYVPLTKTYSLANGLSREQGALIYSPSGQAGLAVISGSPAQKAGLRIGDILVAIDGEEITLEKSLSKILYSKNASGVREVEISFLRDGQEKKVRCEIR